MTKDCPHGWKTNIKTGNLTIEDSTVNICGDICDSADLCGIEKCQHYDTSNEGTHFFMRALAFEETLEGVIDVERARQEIKSNPNFPD